MVLCTGHLSRDEIFALVDGAVGAGIETIVVTHPEFPSQSVAPGDQVELARKGALLERCFTTTHTGKAPWERFYEATRAVGPEHTVWSSDLGQNFNPPVEDGLALMADRFLAAGFSEDDVRTMAVANTRRVAGLAPVAAAVGGQVALTSCPAGCAVSSARCAWCCATRAPRGSSPARRLWGRDARWCRADRAAWARSLCARPRLSANAPKRRRALRNAPYGCIRQHAPRERAPTSTADPPRPRPPRTPSLGALAADRRQATADESHRGAQA